MKHSPAEKRLRNYRLIALEIRFLKSEIRAAEEMLETLSDFHITLEDDVLEKVNQRMQKLEKQIEDLEKEKALVESVIDGLEDDSARKIFKLRYSSQMPWSEVSAIVGYSERQCHRIHNDVIETVISEKLRERCQ